MDVIFLERLDFNVDGEAYALAMTSASREEVLRAAMHCVGIELIDYDSFIAHAATVPGRRARMQVSAFSKAYRARAERANDSR